ncbi:MAG: galactose mutarotase [Sinobacteraceae bacterium]|nr:galactose mutarotase [Nevskiaceae bacterium]
MVPMEFFGNTPDGGAGKLFTLENSTLRVQITDYGGRIVSIEAPDRDGRRAHVVLGFDDVGSYATTEGAFGAILGRTANRIAEGRFTLEGKSYELLRNESCATLHGGPQGFERLFWDVRPDASSPEPSLLCTLVSPDGDQGYPGELVVQARYRLAGDWLWLEFEARTSAATPVSLSAHPYFNLAGLEAHNVLDHEVQLPARHFLPTDAAQIPTGEVRQVEHTPFDFRTPQRLGSRIRQRDEQLLYGHGYDHYFVLPSRADASAQFAARAFEPHSGRVLEIYTTQRGLQLYTGNQLNGSVAGRGGIYRQSAGLALEPQGYPDAENHPHFPSNVIYPNTPYHALIGYHFGVDR